MAAGKGKSPVRVFFKWITGLIFFVFFAATVFLYSLYSLTKEDMVVPLAGRIMASMNTSIPGVSMQQLTAAVRNSRSRSITPFRGLDSTITLQEIEGRSADEIRVLLFSKLAANLYREGVDPFFVKLKEPAIRNKLEPLKPFLYYITADFSTTLRYFLMVPFVVSALLLMLLILLSYRFGKLVSPGVVFLITGLLGIGIFSLAGRALETFSFAVPAQFREKFSALLSGSASDIVGTISGSFFHNFLLVFYAGCALLVLAFFGKFLYNIITGKSESESRLEL